MLARHNIYDHSDRQMTLTSNDSDNGNNGDKEGLRDANGDILSEHSGTPCVHKKFAQLWAANRSFGMFMCNISIRVKSGKQSRFQCWSSVHVVCKQTEIEKERENIILDLHCLIFIMHVQCFPSVMQGQTKKNTHAHTHTMYVCRCLDFQRWVWCPLCVLSSQTRAHTQRYSCKNLSLHRCADSLHVHFNNNRATTKCPLCYLIKICCLIG